MVNGVALKGQAATKSGTMADVERAIDEPWRPKY
jgi:hypothetical protein